jgi:hypothetical protein
MLINTDHLHRRGRGRRPVWSRRVPGVLRTELRLADHTLPVGLGYFLVFRTGTELVDVALLPVLFKRRGRLGSGPTA